MKILSNKTYKESMARTLTSETTRMIWEKKYLDLWAEFNILQGNYKTTLDMLEAQISRANFLQKIVESSSVLEKQVNELKDERSRLMRGLAKEIETTTLLKKQLSSAQDEIRKYNKLMVQHQTKKKKE